MKDQESDLWKAIQNTEIAELKEKLLEAIELIKQAREHSRDLREFHQETRANLRLQVGKDMAILRLQVGKEEEIRAAYESLNTKFIALSAPKLTPPAAKVWKHIQPMASIPSQLSIYTALGMSPQTVSKAFKELDLLGFTPSRKRRIIKQ